MSGKALVENTGDWLTPWEVTVDIDGRQPAVSRFAAGARAQTYVLRMAAEHDLDVEYRVEPRKRRTGPVTPEEFAARITQICSKCKQAKPLAEFRVLWHTNRSGDRRIKPRSQHGWAERCLTCEDEHGEA